MTKIEIPMTPPNMNEGTSDPVSRLASLPAKVKTKRKNVGMRMMLDLTSCM